MATGQIACQIEVTARDDSRSTLDDSALSGYCVLLGPGTADEQGGGDTAEMYGTSSLTLSKNMALSLLTPPVSPRPTGTVLARPPACKLKGHDACTSLCCALGPRSLFLALGLRGIFRLALALLLRVLWLVLFLVLFLVLLLSNPLFLFLAQALCQKEKYK